MRILHVIYDDIRNPWVGGGGATRTLEIYSRIARRGHKVVIVCGNYPGAPRVEMRQGLRYRHVGFSQFYILSRITFMAGAMMAIRRGGYDIVVEDVSAFSPIGAPFWNRQKPSIASVQNLLGMHATQKYGLVGWGPRIVEKLLLQIYRHFVAVSPGIANQIKQVLGHEIDVKVIPNSANPLFFNEGNHRSGIRGQDSEIGEQGKDDKQFGVHGNYILSLGRIDVYQKGLDTLVEAFDLLAERLPDVRLVIAGSGMAGQVGRLKWLVDRAHHRDRIDLLGQVDQPRASKLMRGALLVAIPSRYEGWPLAALEAGATGVPVVGTNIVGVRDAAPQYPEGHSQLAPPDDIDALVDALYKVATDEELRTHMASRGKTWASQFVWDKLAEKQMLFYEELL